MDINLNNTNYTMIIKFSGIVKDFDGYQSECVWDIPSNPNEKIENLISKFFKVSGLDKDKYRLYYHEDNLEKYKLLTLSQKNLTNNSKIDISFIELESLVDWKMPINIKFIKFSENSAFNRLSDLNGLLKLCVLNEMASKIDISFLDQMYNTNKIPQNVYYILKALKNYGSNIDTNNEAGKAIVKMLETNEGCKILNFSNFVDEQINQEWMKQIMNFVPKNYLNEINDTYYRLGKYDRYMGSFEKEIYRSSKNSVFEFSIVSLVILDRQDYDKFETEKKKCPNRRNLLLYHGTQIHPISSILTGMFRRSETSGYQHGKGVYFTDSLDTCWFYGGPGDNRQNMDKIPAIGDNFTAIASVVYYDQNGFLKVNDYKTRIKPGKNEINFAYAGADSRTIVNPNSNQFVGTEYVVWELDQICPFISIKFKRDEFCVIWRDDNFSENPVFGNQYDAIFKNFLKERIRYIKQEAKYNVYPCSNTEEALKLVKRKKYNKIILISNVGPNYGGKQFVDEARKIIQNEVIALFLSYSKQHLQWIQNYKNAIFSNDAKFYEEYLDKYGNESEMRGLISKLEKHYNVHFNFDNNFLNFPLFKKDGKYSDLTF